MATKLAGTFSSTPTRMTPDEQRAQRERYSQITLIGRNNTISDEQRRKALADVSDADLDILLHGRAGGSTNWRGARASQKGDYLRASKKYRGFVSEELEMRQNKTREKLEAENTRVTQEAESVKLRDQLREAQGMRTRFAGGRQGAALQGGSASRLLLGG